MDNIDNKHFFKGVPKCSSASMGKEKKKKRQNKKNPQLFKRYLILINQFQTVIVTSTNEVEQNANY